MYQKFKNSLLKEMIIQRDMLVIKDSEPQLEPIFEVSTTRDKLYRKILNAFDMIAIRNAEKLLYSLCEKHDINANISAAQRFDLEIEIGGESCFVDLKSSPLTMNASSLKRQVEQIKECSQKVYMVFLVKENQKSKSAIATQERIIKNLCGIVDNLSIMLLEDFILKLFGSEELKDFKKAMVNFSDEMHQAVGYQITEIFNAHNLGILRNELEIELKEFDYERARHDRYVEFHSSNDRFRDISTQNFAIINNRFLEQNRFKLLLMDGDFAKSFLTSEWLFKKYFALEEMDNTFIVAGYLKSIEQLLWKVIYLIGQGRSLRGVTVEEDNSEDIDKTLGSLQWFITDYANDDLFEEAFGTSTHYVMNYIRAQLKYWRNEYRNGYFHKHNLEEIDKIKKIREETIFLYFLILGAVSLDDDTLIQLSV